MLDTDPFLALKIAIINICQNFYTAIFCYPVNRICVLKCSYMFIVFEYFVIFTLHNYELTIEL